MYNFSGKKALVTGGTGFLGSHLSYGLEKAGAEVHAISRSCHPAQDSHIKWWPGDLSDIDIGRKFLQEIRPDLVFHLCGHGVGAPDLKNVLPTLHNDLFTAVNVLTLVTEQKIPRLVLAASLEEPQSTDSKIIPSTPYAAAKWASSAYAQMFHMLYKTPVVMVRPYMTYGPRMPNHKMIPYVILSLLRGETPKLGSGNRLVDCIYVDDITRGMLAAGLAQGVEGETFDLGSGKLVPIKSVVLKIAEMIGNNIEPLFGGLPDRPQERVRVAEMESALTRLDWSPTISLEEGLRKTINWYSENLEALGERTT